MHTTTTSNNNNNKTNGTNGGVGGKVGIDRDVVSNGGLSIEKDKKGNAMVHFLSGTRKKKRYQEEERRDTGA